MSAKMRRWRSGEPTIVGLTRNSDPPLPSTLPPPPRDPKRSTSLAVARNAPSACRTKGHRGDRGGPRARQDGPSAFVEAADAHAAEHGAELKLEFDAVIAREPAQPTENPEHVGVRWTARLVGQDFAEEKARCRREGARGRARRLRSDHIVRDSRGHVAGDR